MGRRVKSEAQKARDREYARRRYVPRVRPTVAERLWARVDKSGECWLWTGHLGHGNRYGSIVVDGKSKPTHRVAYELLVGPVPDGLELDHLCREKRCCNPAHLEPVTHAENMRRGQGWAGRNARKVVCDRHGLPLVHITNVRGCRQCRRENNVAYRRRQGGQERAEATRTTWARRSPEERAEISRKIWASRRRGTAA